MDGAIFFWGSLDYENEHFESFCTFWTVKVGLKCCCEKANRFLGHPVWVSVMGPDCGWGFTRLTILATCLKLRFLWLIR